jgi:DUF917 family protein
MLVLRDRTPLVAFPDLIALFDQQTSMPLTSTQVRPMARVAIFTVPAQRLRLGSPMRDRALLGSIEALLKLSFPKGGFAMRQQST